MTPGLTEFQTATESLLRQRLDAHGLVMSNREVSGTAEPFIVASVRDVKIWIYVDEACVIGRGVDRVFEVWDYESPTELGEAFIKQVLDLSVEESGTMEHREGG